MDTDRRMSLECLSAEQARERGNDEFKRKEYEFAKMSYTHALRLEPSLHAVYSNRSFANLKMSLPHLAAADAWSCVSLCPSFVKGHLRLADAYIDLGSIQKAVIALQSAIEGGCAGDSPFGFPEITLHVACFLSNAHKRNM